MTLGLQIYFIVYKKIIAFIIATKSFVKLPRFTPVNILNDKRNKSQSSIRDLYSSETV